ncbi:hypothetical protein Btru_044327 [Bulinus truncatus]|nr:hypothetical protein Btru_044327 [Bulinus truncatus]
MQDQMEDIGEIVWVRQHADDERSREYLEGEKDCSKLHNHSSYIPYLEFDYTMLPAPFQDPLLERLVRSLGYLVVKLNLSVASSKRPAHFPGTKVPYPKKSSCGTGRIIYSTPRVGRLERRCPCSQCRRGNQAYQKWGEIKVVTAAHVVFDDTEAQSATCTLHYNSDVNPFGTVRLQYLRTEEIDIIKDRSVISFITHDHQLSFLLMNKIYEYQKVHKESFEKYQLICNAKESSGKNLKQKEDLDKKGFSNQKDCLNSTGNLNQRDSPDHSESLNQRDSPDHSESLNQRDSPDHSENSPDHRESLNQKDSPDHSESLNQKDSPDHSESLNQRDSPDHSESLNQRDSPDHSESLNQKDCLDQTEILANVETLNQKESLDQDEILVHKEISTIKKNTDNNLAILISHPHGWPKKVSVGHYTRRVHQTNYTSGIQYTYYEYVLTSCGGSSGTPVYILGKEEVWTNHPHMGSNSPQPGQERDRVGEIKQKSLTDRHFFCYCKCP